MSFIEFINVGIGSRKCPNGDILRLFGTIQDLLEFSIAVIIGQFAMNHVPKRILDYI